MHLLNPQLVRDGAGGVLVVAGEKDRQNPQGGNLPYHGGAFLAQPVGQRQVPSVPAVQGDVDNRAAPGKARFCLAQGLRRGRRLMLLQKPPVARQHAPSLHLRRHAAPRLHVKLLRLPGALAGFPLVALHHRPAQRML